MDDHSYKSTMRLFRRENNSLQLSLVAFLLNFQ